MPANEAYSTPAFDVEIDLHLNANESNAALADVASHLASLDSDFVSRYPKHQPLQDLIGQWLGIDAARIIVTAGGDEAIDRIMRTQISDTRRKVVTHAPSFEMVRIYTQNYGGQVCNVPWLLDDFPTNALIESIDDQTAVVVITTPNNPTGREVELDQIQRINEAAKRHGAILLVDYAYVEFAQLDATESLSADPNVLMVRTFSKAWGLAGLRVGYLIAPTEALATTIRNAAGPFPVSAVSLETARVAISDFQGLMEKNVRRILQIRKQMFSLLRACGARPIESGGNYLLVEFDDAESIWLGLAERGIGVRKFDAGNELKNFLRITCPSRVGDFVRLGRALCELTGGDWEQHQPGIAADFASDLVIETPTPISAPLTESRFDGPRSATIQRTTKETDILLQLDLDGNGQVEVDTGIGFLDHMITALAFHSGLNLSLKCTGDLHVDDHHTAEDCAIALGAALDQALGPRKGIKRFGYAYAPLDEALARTVIDLSARPWPEIHLQLQRPMIGQWACENITHFFQSLAMTLKCSLHVDVLRGTNDHHRAEAAFKSMAKALKEALTRTSGDVPSTKGVL